MRQVRDAVAVLRGAGSIGINREKMQPIAEMLQVGNGPANGLHMVARRWSDPCVFESVEPGTHRKQYVIHIMAQTGRECAERGETISELEAQVRVGQRPSLLRNQKVEPRSLVPRCRRRLRSGG